MRVGIALGMVTLPLLSIGCLEAPEAQFVSSDRAKGLVREARRAVDEELVDKFGTPNDLIAWERFPIDYGGTLGTVTAAAESGAVKEFTVEIDSNLETFDDSRIAFTSGTLKALEDQGVRVPVEGYDADTRALTLGQPIDPPPAVGDQFVIDPGRKLVHGKRLYLTHCMHCHGVTGDGNGSTAKYLNPLPRDYRLGIFKFTSTTQTDKARKDDLSRTIKYGIPGTYMPSFMLLEDDELEAIVDYVRWLSIRGEFEKRLVDELESDYSNEAIADRTSGEDGENRDEILAELQRFLEEDFPETVSGIADDLASAWSRSEEEESLVLPEKARNPDDALGESRERGRKLYLSERAKCATCHGPRGIGDGPQTEAFQKIPGTSEDYPEPGLYNVWGHPIEPRNLTRGIYRGGRRPIDLYRRIYAGIKGTPMPAFGGTVLKDEEIWDLVNYVMSIPYDGPEPTARESGEELASNTAQSHGGQ